MSFFCFPTTYPKTRYAPVNDCSRTAFFETPKVMSDIRKLLTRPETDACETLSDVSRSLVITSDSEDLSLSGEVMDCAQNILFRSDELPIASDLLLSVESPLRHVIPLLYLKKIAEGSFKKAFDAATVERLPNSKDISRNGTPKEFVYIQASDARELELLKKIYELSDRKSEAKERPLLAKIYAIKKSAILCKKANLGVLQDVIATLSKKNIASVLIDVLNTLQFLHENEIFHNDLALRNILLHHKRLFIDFDSNEVIGSILGQDIVLIKADRVHETLMKRGTEIEEAHLELLRKNGITKIKIFSKEAKVKGILTDFGCAVEKVESKTLSIAFPADVAAPELFYKGKEKFYPSQKTDLFGVGELLLSAFLRKEESSVSSSKRIIQHRIERFSQVFESKGESALESSDYDMLEDIDDELASITKRLLSYNPEERPSLTEVQDVLVRLARFE